MFGNFTYVIVVVYIAYFESLIVSRNTHIGHVKCLKGLYITAALSGFDSF